MGFGIRFLGPCFAFSNAGVLRMVPGRLLCSCPSFAGYLYGMSNTEERKALMAFFPFLPMPGLFFSLAHPTDKHHFLVSHTRTPYQDLAGILQKERKGRCCGVAWTLAHDPWALPVCTKARGMPAMPQSLCRSGEERSHLYSLDLVTCCLG